MRLKTPSQDRLDSTFSQWDQAELYAWVESLTRGDKVAFANALRSALVAINRTPLNRLGRYDAMECLRPAVNDVCAMLVDSFRASPLPLGEREQEAADLVQQLYAELAVGFKITVNEEIDRGSQSADVTPLQLGIQRALLCLGRVLLERYRVYAPEPPLLWRDIHTLYRNAELAKLPALPIRGTADSDETALSIKQAYLRIAILAMTSPYRLMQGEADELYRRIGRWVHFVQLRPAGGVELGGRFAIDLASDLPARYVPRSAPSLPLGEPRVIELQMLLEAISEQISAATELLAKTPSGSTLSVRMQRDMYMRFRAALSGRSERGSDRKPTLARLMVVDGLTGAHFFLNGRQPFTPEQDEAKWAERLGGTRNGVIDTLKIVGDDEEQSAKQPVRADRASHFEGFDRDADDVWRKASLAAHEHERVQRRARYRAVQWNRKNESDGGMALFCGQDCPMQVRVGELIAHGEEESVDPSRWRIGTIRWLRTRPNGGIELGVKRLADNGYAVGVQAVSGAGKGSEYLRGILIPRVNPVAGKATLLTAAGVYDVDTVVRLNMRDLVIYAQLTELLEATRMFAHFRFKLVDSPGI